MHPKMSFVIPPRTSLGISQTVLRKKILEIRSEFPTANTSKMVSGIHVFISSKCLRLFLRELPNPEFPFEILPPIRDGNSLTAISVRLFEIIY